VIAPKKNDLDLIAEAFVDRPSQLELVTWPWATEREDEES
jgi:hypothetical protein